MSVVETVAGDSSNWRVWLASYDSSDEEDLTSPTETSGPAKENAVLSYLKTTTLKPNGKTPLSLVNYTFDDTCLTVENTLTTTVSFFKECELVEHFNISEKTLRNWLTVVKDSCNNDHPYHNWRHAFNVTQSIFTLITLDCFTLRFTPTDKLVMLVAALCHELCYISRTMAVPSSDSTYTLVDLYSTPWDDFTHMECFVQSLYDHQGCNIFEHILADNELEIMDMISASMAATDLSIGQERWMMFTDLVKDSKVNWNNSKHKKLFRSMTLTACSLAGLAKPWKIHKRMCEAVLRDVATLKVPEHSEAELARMNCDLVWRFLPLFNDMGLVHDGFKDLYFGAVKNYNKWLDIIPQGKALVESTSMNKDKLNNLQDVLYMYIECTNLATNKTDQSLDDIAPATNINTTDESSHEQQCDHGRESGDLQQHHTSEIELLCEDGESFSSNTVGDSEDTTHNTETVDTQTSEPNCKRKKDIFKKILRKVFRVKKHTKPGHGQSHSDKSEPALLNMEDSGSPTQNTDADREAAALKPKHGRKRNIFKKVLQKMFRVQKCSAPKA